MPSEHPRRTTVVDGKASVEPRADVMRRIARIFVAAGDMHRLRLLLLLLDRPMSMRDLAGGARHPISLVSQQVRVLREAKLVEGNREGRPIVYAISDPSMHRFLSQCTTHALAVKRAR